jgi:hypothetical protein
MNCNICIYWTPETGCDHKMPEINKGDSVIIKREIKHDAEKDVIERTVRSVTGTLIHCDDNKEYDIKTVLLVIKATGAEHKK